MKGGPRKTRKRESKKTSTPKVDSETVSSPAAEESSALQGCGFAIDRQSITCFIPSTPKRSRGQLQEAYQTSTPVHSSSTVNLSTSTPLAKQASEGDSPCSNSNSQSERRRGRPAQPKQARKSVTKKQTQTCSQNNGPQAKCRRGRKRKIEAEDFQTGTTNNNQSPERSRPRFELKSPDAEEQDEPLLSSDLSIELSHHEEQLLSLSFQEDEESEEEEELPSFLMQVDKKPPSITEGVFVWYKFRNYPFWPALVKSVNRKLKKASIMFIDYPMIHQKKGFTVALKTLKPFDCDEANELVSKAKENYGAAIEWSLELITDYRIRIACGSFSGSFIEYFGHDISYPVRRKYPEAASERLTISSDTMMDEPCDDHKDSFSEQQEEVNRTSKRLLPDRTHAAHNRANEKLVHFIVKQRMVEGRLLV
ncbi:hypothetical protein PAMA_000310 [Pampus argenteus]